MSMKKTDLELCVDLLEQAKAEIEREKYSPGRMATIQAVGYLAEYCRDRVADHPALYPHQLDAAIQNLCDRIEALENQPPRNETTEPDVAEEWRRVLDEIRDDCQRNKWTGMDAIIAWRMGSAAMYRVRYYRGVFPHDPEGRS